MTTSLYANATRASLVLALIWSGCGGGVDLAAVSSGRVGCAPERVRIVNDSGPFVTTRTWTVVCADARWFCSATGQGREYRAENISCAAEHKGQ